MPSYRLVLLVAHSLDVLAGKDRVIIDDAIDANMRFGVGIELLGLGGEVEVEWERPRESEEDQRNAHGMPGADLICHVSEDDGDDGTTTNGGDEERSAALCVTTNASHCSRLATGSYA